MYRIKKSFATSGGFKKKQKELVRKIVKKFPTPKFSVEDIETASTNATEVQQCGNHEMVTHHQNLRQISNTNSELMKCSAENEIFDANITSEGASFINCDEQNDESETSNAESLIEINVENDLKSHENGIKSRDFLFNKTQFKSALAAWAIKDGIKHDQLRGLLKIWNEYVPLPKLPIDPRTLLETPRNIVIMNNNQWHRGLKNALEKILQKCPNVPDTISLKINTDGITISKSSGVECWPILVEIAEMQRIPPEIVDIYCGQGKPKDLESYLRPFVNELIDCMSNGLAQNGRNLKVKLMCFIADSPARAFLKSRSYKYFI